MMHIRKLLLGLLLALTCDSLLAANLSDNFTRANETTLAAPWAAVNPEYQGLAIVSNRATAGPLTNSASLSWRTDSQNNYSQVTFASVSGENDSGPTLHNSNSGSDNSFVMGAIYLDTGIYYAYIAAHTAGNTWTDIVASFTSPVTPIVGMTVRLRRVSNTFYFEYWNVSTWTLICSGVYGGALSGGYDGIRVGYLNTTEFSQWANYDTFALATVVPQILQQSAANDSQFHSDYMLAGARK